MLVFEQSSILEYISQMCFFLFKYSAIIIMQLTSFTCKYEEIPNNPHAHSHRRMTFRLSPAIRPPPGKKYWYRGTERVDTAPSEVGWLVGWFFFFVILVCTAAGSEPTETMASVSISLYVVLESTGVGVER